MTPTLPTKAAADARARNFAIALNAATLIAIIALIVIAADDWAWIGGQ